VCREEKKNGLHRALADGRSMPVTAFYDAQGKLLDAHIGLLPEKTLRTAIRQLYGDPPGHADRLPQSTYTRTPLSQRTPGR